MSSKTAKAAERYAALDKLVSEIETARSLDNWNAFARELSVPMDMLPALMTGRVELLKIVGLRAMSEPESAAVLKAMAALIETNMLLQQHAQQVAQMVKQWSDAFRHLHGVGLRIEAFANYKPICEPDSD